ncbi:RHS repeat-associated core domain-containing protein [Pseudomonas sp. PAGU 2196]|uniref:RHS repeat-associated core domain-containing protein n=1 Tax=Pseudomonas sp. PAGU 2196 TaxID=2793997 RepID=UPI001EE02BC1|nr:RHS repeat-associated core domain-containing protein [Pseudomonas sp. PAGU 2196]
MKTFTGAWFFYEGDAVRTVWQEGRCSSLIQAAGMRLVERKVANDLQQTMMLASDGMGSVVGESGTRSKSVAYSPYGFQRGMESLIGFAGQMQSLLPIGYFLGNGYRFFDVVTNRFNSPDGFSPFGRGGVNAYVYCGGDPVNCTDPSGHITYYHGLSSHFDWVASLTAPTAPTVPSARTGPSYYSDGLFGKSQVQNFPRVTSKISPRSEGVHASRKRAAPPVKAGGAKRVKQEGGLIQSPQAVDRGLVKARMTDRIEHSQLEFFSNDSNVPDNRTIALDYLDMLLSQAAEEAREALYNKYGRTVRVVEVKEYVYHGVSGIVSWIRRSAKR